MAPVFANSQANGFAIFGERSSVNDEIYGRLLFITSPETDLVVDQIDAGAALGNLVGANDFLELNANARASVRHGQTNDGGILFEAAPVAFKGKSFSANDAQRGEQTPAADEASLSGREADFFDGEKLVVMKNVAIDQSACLAGSRVEAIVADEGSGQ